MLRKPTIPYKRLGLGLVLEGNLELGLEGNLELVLEGNPGIHVVGEAYRSY